MSFNRDELYVPIPPYTVAWHRGIHEPPGHAGPFMDLYPALYVMVGISVTLQHDGYWLRQMMIDGYDTVIAGYTRFPRIQVAVNPLAMRPVGHTDLLDLDQYDDWARKMTENADRLALAPYEQEQS